MKFLWRAIVAGIAKPIYLVAQNIQSAHAKLVHDPTVAPDDTQRILRIDAWDDQANMTVVVWPEPPPPPQPDPASQFPDPEDAARQYR